jgi:hypothetical protein
MRRALLAAVLASAVSAGAGTAVADAAPAVKLTACLAPECLERATSAGFGVRIVD